MKDGRREGGDGRGREGMRKGGKGGRERRKEGSEGGEERGGRRE